MDGFERNLAKQIGRRVRLQRQAAELGMENIGEVLGQTADAVSKAERGERRFSVADLVRLSDLFGCLVEFLIHGRKR
jgi:transcriptional regulator with XRE-family HTH domain